MENLIRFASNNSAACSTILPQAIISAQDKYGHLKPDSNSTSGMPKMDAKRAQRKRLVIQWEKLGHFCQFSSDRRVLSGDVHLSSNVYENWAKPFMQNATQFLPIGLHGASVAHVWRPFSAYRKWNSSPALRCPCLSWAEMIACG